MKTLAVFCDGTWNSMDAPCPTNVAIMYDSVETEGDWPYPPTPESQKIRQVKHYVPGVGTRRRKAGWIETQVDRLTGGAFGCGLDAKLEAAYRDIAEAFEPGDRLFLFGFSRGAYTARSLAGLLRNCGLPRDGSHERTREAIRFYRNREPSSHPDAPAALRFRAEFSPEFATSETDWLVRGKKPHRLYVDYLGIWDTVGALGVPARFGVLAAIFNRKYRFHDTRLSSMVKAARHAVAIDERRATFPPTLWENLYELNADNQHARYLQAWFPGTHGGVGGGGPNRGLSDAALLWVADGAREHGLAIDPKAVDDWMRGSDLGADVDNKPGRKGLVERWLERDAVDRAAPPGLMAVSSQARKKWREFDYRPVPLRPFAPRLDPPVLPDEWDQVK